MRSAGTLSRSPMQSTWELHWLARVRSSLGVPTREANLLRSPPQGVIAPCTCSLGVEASVGLGIEPVPSLPQRTVLPLTGWSDSTVVMLPRVRVQPFKLIRIDGAHHPRREQALEQAANPARAIPGRRDPYQRRAVLLGNRRRRDHAQTGVALSQDLAWLRLIDPHPVLTGPPSR